MTRAIEPRKGRFTQATIIYEASQKMIESVDRIATEWIKYTFEGRPAEGEAWADRFPKSESADGVASELSRVLREDPDTAQAIVDKILQKSSDPWILVNVGAGPVEHMLVDNYPPRIDAVRELALKHTTMKYVLENVWLDDASEETRLAVENIMAGFSD